MNKKGFTLIELLVVIGIIGLLASIVLSSLDGARKKGRDARRISDVKQIQLALELYYDANSAFPTSISSADTCGAASCAVTNLVTPGYISVVPRDPSNDHNYAYTPLAAASNGTPCISYHLGTSLETAGHPVFQTDADATASTLICLGGPAADFNGTDATTGNSRCINGSAANADYGIECYDVKP